MAALPVGRERAVRGHYLSEFLPQKQVCGQWEGEDAECRYYRGEREQERPSTASGLPNDSGK